MPYTRGCFAFPLQFVTALVVRFLPVALSCVGLGPLPAPSSAVLLHQRLGFLYSPGLFLGCEKPEEVPLAQKRDIALLLELGKRCGAAEGS